MPPPILDYTLRTAQSAPDGLSTSPQQLSPELSKSSLAHRTKEWVKHSSDADQPENPEALEYRHKVPASNDYGRKEESGNVQPWMPPNTFNTPIRRKGSSLFGEAAPPPPPAYDAGEAYRSVQREFGLPTQNSPSKALRPSPPSSVATASSEDERPWPSSITFENLPRKENGVPQLLSGIWASSKSRGSLKLGEQARRNAAREARMGAPNNASIRPTNTSSSVSGKPNRENSRLKQDPVPMSETRDSLADENANVSRLLLFPEQQWDLLEATRHLVQMNAEEQTIPTLETEPIVLAAESARPRAPRRSVSYASSCSSAASAASRGSRCSNRSRRPRSRRVKKRGKATVHMPSQSPSLSPVEDRNGLLSPLDDRRSSSTTNRLDKFLDPAYRELSPFDGADDHRQQKHPATFACTLCPKRFTRAYNLRSHLRTHTDERPFACTVCGKAFARQVDRKRHEGLHSSDARNSTMPLTSDALETAPARPQRSLGLIPESGMNTRGETEALMRDHEDASVWSCGMMSDEVATCSRSTLVDGRHITADACGYCGVAFAAPADWDARRQHFDDAHKHKQCNHAKKFFSRDGFRLHLKHSHTASQGEWTEELEAKCSGRLVPAPETRQPFHEVGPSAQRDTVPTGAVEADASVLAERHESLQPTAAEPWKKRKPLRLPAPIYDQDSSNRRTHAYGENARQVDLGVDSPSWTQLYRDVVKWCRPALRSNHARLEWRCHCGQHFWGDFEYGEPEQIRIFAHQIERHGFAITAVTTPFGTTTTASAVQQPDKQLTTSVSQTSTSSTQQTNASPTASSTTHTSLPSITTSYASNASNASFFTTRKPVYLEVCIDRSSRITHLGEIVLVNGSGQQIIANDLDLFVSIRKKYDELKRKGLFALLYRPTDIHYVQFGIQLSAQQTDIYQKPDSLPPRVEVDENRYHYYECPLTPLPPMPTKTFYQYFRGHTPNCASRSTLFSDRLPKKLGTNMTSLASADKLEFGWGIHIIEGPNKPLLAALVAVILVLSFLTSVVYDVCTKNADSGFAIGQWMVGMLSAVLAAVYFHLQEQ